MPLTVTVGADVVAVVNGHSANNGAMIPAGSSVVPVSNDTSVATVGAVPDLANDMAAFNIPVTVLASGSADISVTVTAPDGSTFTASDSLIVAPAVPGLTHITLELVTPVVTPLR